MKNLQLIPKHSPCQNDHFDIQIGFKYYDINGDILFEGENNNYNLLFFILDGELNVSYNEFYKVRIYKNELFLIPKPAELSVIAYHFCHMIVFSFESLKNIWDKIAFKAYSTIASQHEHNFKSLPIRYTLIDYLHLLIKYLHYGLNCDLMYRIKLQELILLFKKFYTKEELANLFHPVLGKSPDFKEMVLQNYQLVNSVEELAQKLGMSRTNLDVKFKKEFGISPLQWMLKQKAKRMKFSLLEPDNTLTDIMQKFNFNSPTHLNRFCKQQFGCSPSELRKKLNDNGITL